MEEILKNFRKESGIDLNTCNYIYSRNSLSTTDFELYDGLKEWLKYHNIYYDCSIDLYTNLYLIELS